MELFYDNEIKNKIKEWLLEDEANSVLMKFKNKTYYYHYGWDEPCDEIRADFGYNQKVDYIPRLTYEWGEPLVELDEHQIDFKDVKKLIFEDYRGNEVKELVISEEYN
jgi:hypothetical protein